VCDVVVDAESPSYGKLPERRRYSKRSPKCQVGRVFVCSEKFSLLLLWLCSIRMLQDIAAQRLSLTPFHSSRTFCGSLNGVPADHPESSLHMLAATPQRKKLA
jgi:hypothetical protein